MQNIVKIDMHSIKKSLFLWFCICDSYPEVCELRVGGGMLNWCFSKWQQNCCLMAHGLEQKIVKKNETRSLKRNEGGRFAAIFVLLVTVRGPLTSDRLHLCSWQMLLVPAGGSDRRILNMQES